MLLFLIQSINLTAIFDKRKISVGQLFRQQHDRLLLIIFNKIFKDFKVTRQSRLEIYYRVEKLTVEEKIIAAIQHTLSKSNKRVTSQRIFRFINKGAINIGCELFEDCINNLEIGGRIYQKMGNNASFFINSKRVKKLMSRIMRTELINPLDQLKQLKNWNILLTKFLENFQNITPNVPTINTPLLY